MKYFKEAQEIWRKFVPKSGQADTVQGELLRAVEKLRDEAQRNGNGNWDDGFELLLIYLNKHLLDSSVYSEDTIRGTKAALARLRNHDDPYLEDDLYDGLGDRVVEYFQFRGSQPHAKNTALRR
jgi:hypothetical protein